MVEFVKAATAMATELGATKTSKLARRIARKLGSPSDDQHIDSCIIDLELTEVREVLDGLIEFSDQVIEAWEIKPLPAHSLCLERARALYEKLKTDLQS